MKLYARQEVTTDPVLKQHGKIDPKRHRDVVLYRDPECTRKVGAHPWHHASKPDGRHKTTMLNCARYALVWVK